MKDLSANIQLAELEIKKSKYELDVFAFEEYLEEKDSLMSKAIKMYEDIIFQAKEFNQIVRQIKNLSTQKGAKVAAQVVKLANKKNASLLKELPKTHSKGEELLTVYESVKGLKTTDFSNKIDLERVNLKSAQRYAKSPNHETRQLLIQKQTVQS